jgi:mRNA interferase RelE/StbE
MAYRVQIMTSAQRQLSRLNRPLQKRISAVIDNLPIQPRPPGVKKLQGMDYWRIRVGDYRIIYQIQDDKLLVLVIRVAHRAEAYR